MKSTSCCLTVALLGVIAASGCHQAAHRVAAITSSLPVPGTEKQDFETRLSLARTHEREGKLRTARREYRRLLKEEPSNAIVHHRLGVIAGSKEDFDEANVNFKRAFELAPNNPDVISDWGYCLFLQGEFEEAAELARRGSELAPDDPRIANNLALVLSSAPMNEPIFEPSDPMANPVVQFHPTDQESVVAVPVDSLPDDIEEVQPAGFEGRTQQAAETITSTPPLLPPAEANEAAAIDPAISSISAIMPGDINDPGIGIENVRKLLTRARLELAAGDVQMSHAFAEAAAEIAIPLDVFEKSPEKVLDEIEFVTNHNSVMTIDSPTLKTAGFTQAVPPAPAPYVEGDQNVDASQKAGSSDSSKTDDPQGFRAINRTSLSIFPKLGGAKGERLVLPERRAYRRLSQVPVVKHTVGYNREWTPMTYSWEAPALKYNPLYFEDAQLERYGNEVCILQPFLSGARFYATLPTLPYQMMSEGNSVCHTVYDLGHERPGNCVPYALEVPEFSWTGGLATGGWAFALIVILP